MTSPDPRPTDELAIAADGWSREVLRTRIQGSLTTAALGDAMGAGVEQLATHEIVERHGGLLRELARGPGRGRADEGQPGEYTDDASQMFTLVATLVEHHGELTDKAWLDALLHWADTSPAARFAGPTTRSRLQVRAPGAEATVDPPRQDPSFGATNGSAMRVAPAGLVRPGDVEGAVELAWISSRVTHDTQLAAAGAGAIAAGAAAALAPRADVLSVAVACLRGAELGERLGIRDGRRVPGPSVARRIELAIHEAISARGLEDAIARIEATVGNGVLVAESVPAAVGVFVAGRGDPFETLVAGVNIGNDTDTIATMAGSLAGALHGAAGLPPHLVDELARANPDDLAAAAAALTDVAWSRLTHPVR
jgi:ADP-ribosylglycohydrolase